MPLLGSLFQLPAELFNSATTTTGDPASLPSAETIQPENRSTVASTSASTSQDSASRTWEIGATCIACGIGVGGPGFDSAAEQRAHFKSDWHRLNVKRRIAGQPPLPEQEFERMLEQQDEVGSISGSDSSDSEGDDENEGRQQGKQAAGSSIPQVAFKTADGSSLSVWRCLLTGEQGRAASQISPSVLLQELQRLRTTVPLKVVVIMLRGGHFAAAVFNVPSSNPVAGSDGKSGRLATAPHRVGEAVAHKTFHRYVVRAKAGGKQSTQDATGKFAKSAGSRLRRYNEAALEADIKSLLISWKEHLDAAHLIFVQAPASNARTIFHGDNAPLSAADPRVRKVPFTTQRPTGAEVERVLRTLFSVYQQGSQDDTQPDVSTSSEQQPTPVADKAPSRPTADKRVAESGATSTSSREGGAEVGTASTGQPPGPSGKKNKNQDTTPLHRACQGGDAGRVKQLLESGLDPTVKDGKGKTAYSLAANKDVRDTFRRFMAQHPDKWDYHAADVPSPLTDEMEASQQAKKASKAAKQKANQATRKQNSQPKQQEQQQPAAKTLTFDEELALAAAEAAAISARNNNAGKKGKGKGSGNKVGSATSAPTPEDLAKRREVMAAAAEARLKALQLVQQQQKLWN